MLTIGENQVMEELKGMKRRMDALYSKSFEQQATSTSAAEATDETWWPLIDAWESDREWTFSADLPGVSDEELKVEVTATRLILTGNREILFPPGNCETLRAERPGGRFCRSFALPSNAQREAITAEFRKGVLNITIPKIVPGGEALHKVSVKSA